MGKFNRRDFLKLSFASAAMMVFDGNVAVPKVAYASTPFKLKDTKVTNSVCIYCGVGCGLLVYSKGSKVVNVEGDPDNPNSEGGLCAKGSTCFSVYDSPLRLKKPMYRAPGSDKWEEKSWDWTISELVKRIKKTRDSSFVKTSNGVAVNRTEGLAMLGGAAHGTDECYLFAKVARALGIVYLEHQARICHSSTVTALGPSFGRGAMTNSLIDVKNSDVIMICGGNPAENHPGSARYINMCKERGGKVISVDPRFTRTSAISNIYAQIRPGTDIAFFGGLINYILQNNKYQDIYVKHYTNASYLLKPEFDFQDGYFSGWDITGKSYNYASWAYQTGPDKKPLRDMTLQDPSCVFQKMKLHYSRYTPDVVEKITGINKETFQEIAQLYSSTGAPDKSGTLMYAMGLTQHTIGTQNIRAFCVIQLLLGNLGMAGGGVNAMRGETNVQGSTDMALLYNSWPGYLAAPNEKLHPNFKEYLKKITLPDCYWSNAPKFAVSMLKAWFGDAATKENDFGYDWLPKWSKPASWMYIWDNLYKNEGIKGMMIWGQNPLISSPLGDKTGKALENLDWLMSADIFETETANFWRRPGADPKSIKTEVFMLPISSFVEKNGSATNTSRWLQMRYKAIEPLYESKEDMVVLDGLVRGLKKQFKDDPSTPSPEAMLNLTWGYGGDKYDIDTALKEINGFEVATKKQLVSFAALKEDGSTACGCWIYSGVYPPAGNLAARRKPEKEGIGLNSEWAWSWPVNRRILYNRASCDLEGNPWNPKLSVISWDSAQKKWTGRDIPDFLPTKAPSAPGGDAPFIMIPEGGGRLFVPAGIVKDGPFPEHYEPIEAPVKNLISSVQNNPVAIVFKSNIDKYAPLNDPKYPYICTTYRLTEHYQSGTITRKIPILVEEMPQVFAEIDPELAKNLGIKNGDKVELESIRGKVKAQACVTSRLQPIMIDGKKFHIVGIPWHWGFVGIDPDSGKKESFSANLMTENVGDPTSEIQESKALMINLRRA
ncbi:MAG: formate dehydrogenase-N subunit alpha [Thermodesulfobium sp.]